MAGSMAERGTHGETGQDFWSKGVGRHIKPEPKWNCLGKGRVGGGSV